MGIAEVGQVPVRGASDSGTVHRGPGAELNDDDMEVDKSQQC